MPVKYIKNKESSEWPQTPSHREQKRKQHLCHCCDLICQEQLKIATASMVPHPTASQKGPQKGQTKAEQQEAAQGGERSCFPTCEQITSYFVISTREVVNQDKHHTYVSSSSELQAAKNRQVLVGKKFGKRLVGRKD